MLETLLPSPSPAGGGGGGGVGVVFFLLFLPSFIFLVVFEMIFCDERGCPVMLQGIAPHCNFRV